MDEDQLVLGGNIELSGFKDIDKAMMVVVKKMVGNYVKKLSTLASKFESIVIHLKVMHEREKGEVYEIKGRVSDNGTIYNSHAEDRNLFFALNAAFDKMDTELSKATQN